MKINWVEEILKCMREQGYIYQTHTPFDLAIMGVYMHEVSEILEKELNDVNVAKGEK